MESASGYKWMLHRVFSAYAKSPKRHLGAVLFVIVLAAVIYLNTLGNSLVIDSRIFSESNISQSPGSTAVGYHLANLLLHALNGVLLYLTLVMLLSALGKMIPSYAGPEGDTLYAPLAAALFFVSHPMQTEAVNSAFGRPEALMALFAFASVLFYLKASLSKPHSGRSYYVLALAMYVLSCISKTSAVFFPLVFIAIDACARPSDMSESFSWKSKVPVYIGFAVAGAVFAFLWLFKPANPYGFSVQDSKMFFDASGMLLTYAGLLIFPFFLKPEYGFDAAFSDKLSGSFTDPRFYLPLAAVVCLVAAVIALRKKRPMVFLGAAWFFVTILPAFNTQLWLLDYPMREKYLYLPCAGFSAALAFELCRFGREGTGAIRPDTARRIAFSLIFFIILAYSARTAVRNLDWKDGVTFWTAALRTSPMSYQACYNLGLAYRDERKDQAKAVEAFKEAIQRENMPAAHDALGVVYYQKGLYSEAMAEFTAANSGDPSLWSVYYHMGLLYLASGEYDKAIEIEKKGIANAGPSFPHYTTPSLADMHDVAGKAYVGKKDFHNAAAEFGESLRSRPGDPEVLFNLGKAHLQNGDHDKAAKAFNAALVSDPGNIQIRYALAGLYIRTKEFDNAEREYAEILRIDPRNSDSRNNLANIYYSKRLIGKAVAEFKKVIETDPSHFQARNNLANIYLMEGEFDRAISEYRRVIEAHPESAAVHYNLGLAYKGMGMAAEAESEWRQALSIDPVFQQAAQALRQSSSKDPGQEIR